MKKAFALALLFLAVLASLSAQASQPSIPLGDAVALAEAALSQTLDGVPVLDADLPMPGDMWLCGPFLCLEPSESDPDELYIPNQRASDYAAAGLPSGARILADETLVSADDAPEGVRTVFPLLFCPGYCGSASYTSLGSVSHHAYSALLIDRATGEVAARVDGPLREGTSMMLSQGDYRRDMNDRYVFQFNSTPRRLKDMWIDVFSTAAVNGRAFFLEDGDVTGMLGDDRGELVIPDGATGIGKEAFQGRGAITAVRFPDSLTAVGERAFEGCTNLAELELPAGVTLLSYNAFQDCAGLRRVSLPEGLSELRYNCFSGCASLEEIDLPDRLEEIGDGCFSGCASLARISIPGKSREIPRFCFSGCTALASVGFSGGISRIGAGAFDGCKSLTALSFPGNTESVGAGAFRDCDSLASISFDVTRRFASQKWDPAWRDGCGAEIHWKRDPLFPALAAVAAAIAILAAFLVLRRKSRVSR